MSSTTITTDVARNLRRQGFEVLNRPQWGSKFPGLYDLRRKIKPAVEPADTVVQHITVTLDHGPLTGHFRTDVQTIERIGMERFGSGISYNFVVDMRTGMIALGMPLDAKGTHTVNNKNVKGFSYDQNEMARAIAVLGMPNDKLRWRGRRAIAGILVAMAEEGATTKHPDYVPHSMFANKDCPCESTRSQMPRIYRRFEKQLAKRGSC